MLTPPVDALTDVSGVGAIETATSVLGNLLAWCIAKRHGELMISGSTCTDYFKANPPSTNTNAGFVWLWDWCGLDLPARTAATACLRGVAPGSSNKKTSGVLKILIGFERTARYSKNAFEACHAAGWALMMRCALRFKQSVGLVINAIVQYYHESSQRTFTLLSASILKDKNKNKEKQRPRPVWCVIDALDGSRCIVDRVIEMLSHEDPNSGKVVNRCVLRETNAPRGGDLSQATSWMPAPLLATDRIQASLTHSLIAAGLSSDEADEFRPHFAKRFTLNVADAARCFSSSDKNEIGRFSGSTAQMTELEPVKAMLQQHQLRCSVLPARYAEENGVRSVFDLLCLWHIAAEKAAARAAADPALLGDPWGPGLWRGS